MKSRHLRPRAANAYWDDRGSQLAELALVAPLLILFVLVIVDGARLVRTHQVINNAAREGARLSSLGPNHQPSCGASNGYCGVVAQVEAYAAQNGVTLTDANISVNNGAFIPGTGVYGSRVTITFAYTPLFVGTLRILGLSTTIQLQGSAEFKNLTY